MKNVTAAFAWIARFLTRRHGHDQPAAPAPTLASRLRIVSDGTPQGTSVTLDGVPLDRVTRSLMLAVHTTSTAATASFVEGCRAARRRLVAEAAELVERAKDLDNDAVRRYGFCSEQAGRSHEALLDAQHTYRRACAELTSFNSNGSWS